MPALVRPPGFGLFVLSLQIAQVELQVAFSSEDMVVVLYGAQTRGVAESAERPTQSWSRTQPCGQQTPGCGAPITPCRPSSGRMGSAAVWLKTVPATEQSVESADPRQNPSVALNPATDSSSSMACSVAAVTQMPLAQSLAPRQVAPALPVPATGAQMARQDEPLCVCSGAQARPSPPPSAAQSASSRQTGMHEATTLALAVWKSMSMQKEVEEPSRPQSAVGLQPEKQVTERSERQTPVRQSSLPC